MMSFKWGKAIVAAAFLISAGTAQAQDSCATDFDGNGVTDADDVAVMQSAMGTGDGDEGYIAAADLNGDGTVSMADYAILLSCN